MKKKIVTVVLSVAVATSMMFAVTACGSKDNASSTPANTPVEDTAAPETSTVAAEEPTTAAAEDGMISLEDWLNSEENAAQIDAVLAALSNDEMTMEFEADGDVFVMKYTLNETLELDDDAKAVLNEELEGGAVQFETMRDALTQETGNPNIKIRIEYINGDGSELFTYEY